MKIYNKFASTIYYTSKPKNEIKNKKAQEAKTNKYNLTPAKVSAAIVTSAIAGIAIGGAIVSRRPEVPNRAIEDLMSKKTELSNRLTSTMQELNSLRKNLTSIKSENEALKIQCDEYSKNINAILLSEDKPDKAIAKNILENIQADNIDYYNIKMPVERKIINPYWIHKELPETVSTTNRADMKPLVIPEITPLGSFHFAMPYSDEIKISKVSESKIIPIPLKTTTISASYADSIKWNNDKIARDLLQNFFDGHGQTLDGVKLTFSPVLNKYRVRIEGLSTYDAENAIYLGESSKRADKNAAGNFGEGLKVSTLKLLQSPDTESVRIGSSNWKITYTIANDSITNNQSKKVLAFSLENAEKFDGNYIEFETSNLELLESLRLTLNRFYHSSNPDFKCPEFENNVIGIKRLENDAKGGVYIAGQRFEVNGDFDGLNGVSIFIKEKPPINVLDPSRDRTSLNSDHFKALGEWIGNDEKLVSNDDFPKLIKALEPYWDFRHQYNSPEAKFVRALASEGGMIRFLQLNFPSNYIAYSNASTELVQDLIEKGFTICDDKFHYLGMQDINEVVKKGRAHKLLQPTEEQKEKILIMREALNTLAPVLSKKYFKPNELKARIYIFDKSDATEKELNSNTLAEAIIKNNHSKGFWIDKEYLDNTDFSNALETALHELCHKFGGDETSIFSYALTDVNAIVQNELVNNNLLRTKIKILSDMWNSLNIKTN